MGIYSKYFLPKIVHWACSLKPQMKQREKVIPLARGQVLEIGIGSGLNLPYYDATKVTRLWGLEPSPEMVRIAAAMVHSVGFPVEFIGLPGDEIPLDDNSVDTVVTTYTLCSISDTEPALRQMARILRPGGQLIFCEHGSAPDESVRAWQNRVTPIWKRLAGGCHLNRNIPSVLEQGGFKVVDLETMYIPGWRPASFNFWGSATAG